MTTYLGWATLACFAGFGTTFRSLGMPAEARWTNEISVVLVLSATIMSSVRRGSAGRGAGVRADRRLGAGGGRDRHLRRSVRLAAILAITVVLAVVIGRTLRSPERDVVLFG